MIPQTVTLTIEAPHMYQGSEDNRLNSRLSGDSIQEKEIKSSVEQYSVYDSIVKVLPQDNVPLNNMLSGVMAKTLTGVAVVQDQAELEEARECLAEAMGEAVGLHKELFADAAHEAKDVYKKQVLACPESQELGKLLLRPLTQAFLVEKQLGIQMANQEWVPEGATLGYEATDPELYPRLMIEGESSSEYRKELRSENYLDSQDRPINSEGYFVTPDRMHYLPHPGNNDTACSKYKPALEIPLSLMTKSAFEFAEIEIEYDP